jgi:hypothetical protein
MSVRAPAYWRLVERAEARVLEAAVVVVAATVAATGVLVATAPHGLAVTPDSVHYLSAADSLRAGHGLIGFDGVPLTHFAPGFPVAVAAVWEVAASSMQSARILNALCLAWIVLCGWALLRRLVASPVLRLVGAAGLAVAPTLYTVSVTAWSEPLFIAIVLASVLTLTIGLDRERDWPGRAPPGS